MCRSKNSDKKCEKYSNHRDKVDLRTKSENTFCESELQINGQNQATLKSTDFFPPVDLHGYSFGQFIFYTSIIYNQCLTIFK